MPEIIDNKKVGEYIKELLKDADMTQNDLANALHITKSAVSQNLNGKSTFDLQNLVRIAELFEISLDTLLDMKSGKDNDVISEYERMVKKGLDELKTVEINSLIISTPDLYGKVFIEYVIEYNKRDIFEYIINNNIKLYEDTHSNLQEVLLKIMIYMVKEQMNGFIHFVSIYVNQYGSLTIKNKEFEKELFEELNKYNDDDVLAKLLNLKVETKKSFIRAITKNKQTQIRSNIEWIKTISKYQLDHLFELLTENKDLSIRFDDILYQMILLGYKKGVVRMLESIVDDKHTNVLSNKRMCQKAIVLVSQLSSSSIVDTMIEKGIYNDLSEFLITLFKEDKKELSSYVLDTYKDSIDYRRVGIYLVESDNLIVLQRIQDNLSQETLDYLLSKTTVEQIESNKLLIQTGAQFDTKYFNRDTASKMNKILSNIMNGEAK